MANYDYAKVKLKNDSGSTLTFSSKDLDDGKWAKEPVSSVADSETADWLFVAESDNNATTGPSGKVEYLIENDDGTFIINFNVPYSGDQYCHPSIEGATAGNYTIDKKQMDGSDTSGPYKDVQWKITLTKA